MRAGVRYTGRAMTWTAPPARTGHPYYMHDAIDAQPAALALVARANADALATAAARLRAVSRVWLAGIGTSWHAALVGELLFAHAGGLGGHARAFHSFELVTSWPPPPPGTGLVVISHRGSLPFSAEALAAAKASGAVTVAITGPGSDALDAADVVLRTAEQETSNAHTVSYTSALLLLAALAAAVGGAAAMTRALETVPDLVRAVLRHPAWDDLAARFDGRRRYWFVGGGPNTATAYEAALKMSEANHAIATGLNCEQFLHGPYAAMEPDDALVVIAPPGRAYERCLAGARVARAIGAPVLALVRGADQGIAALATATVALPEVDELLSPIVAAVPLQRLTYHLALRRGRNPDTMRADEPPWARARAALWG